MTTRFLLNPEDLTSLCKVVDLEFETTEDLKPLKGIIGQKRAVDALAFGLRVKKKGYNIYVSGLTGTGRSSYTCSITRSFARKMKSPKDWLYVYNFSKPDSPKAISLEGGTGEQFKKDADFMVAKLKKEISTLFESSEYKNKKTDIVREFQNKNLQLIRLLNDVALEHGFIFKESEQGLITVPLKDGNPMSKKDYEDLTQEDYDNFRKKSHYLTLETEHIFEALKQLEDELEEKFNELDMQEGTQVVDYYTKKLINCYEDNPQICQYIKDIRDDVVQNIQLFKNPDDDNRTIFDDNVENPEKLKKDFFLRYQVNLFVNNKHLKYAPIINESNPSYHNLNGAIEYRNDMGVLRTDFTKIKPGAIHMANGGYIILQAKDLLSQPYAWEALIRAIKTGEILIDGINNYPGQIVTSSLKPEPIPLDLKVIIIGDLYIYHLLHEVDEEFRKLFKIMADFDVEINKSDENVLKMARFIATHCEEVGLRHFDKTAVARVIEYSSRLADHQDKISSQFNKIVEVLYEADTWAELDDSNYVLKQHVEKAINQKIYRNSKYEEKLNEMFQDGTMLIDVSGEKVGQINGLAVMGTGHYAFGKPSRITVSTYKGKPGIISIEREAKKSGSIHDKGILVLSGFLGCRYAQEKSLSLSVSISFEQNYSMIDGDSASSTELYGIISSIAGVPIKQNIAVTGSVNQKGEIQPVGGINEKIEGFFHICKIKGLTGDQGVIIPKQNVKNLMLNEEVLKAVKNKKFHIYAISHVDEGIEILTDTPAGQLENGKYPEGTINYLVMQKINS